LLVKNVPGEQGTQLALTKTKPDGQWNAFSTRNELL